MRDREPRATSPYSAAAINAKIVRNRPPNVTAKRRVIRRVSGRGLKVSAEILISLSDLFQINAESFDWFLL